MAIGALGDDVTCNVVPDAQPSNSTGTAVIDV